MVWVCSIMDHGGHGRETPLRDHAVPSRWRRTFAGREAMERINLNYVPPLCPFGPLGAPEQSGGLSTADPTSLATSLEMDIEKLLMEDHVRRAPLQLPSGEVGGGGQGRERT